MVVGVFGLVKLVVVLCGELFVGVGLLGLGIGVVGFDVL